MPTVAEECCPRAGGLSPTWHPLDLFLAGESELPRMRARLSARLKLPEPILPFAALFCLSILDAAI